MKKLLAMVLALVMTLSLAVSANAFKDDKSISDDYAEAVAVLNGMGVFKGYEDGSFKPQGDITRAEVSAIVYRVYTQDVKDAKASMYATYNKFSDMAGAGWAQGYIGYCANAELVKGYPDGTFKPSGKVTGYEVLAMILRAVGYDKNGEFSGADWALHVAQTAQQAGVLKNVKGVDLNAPATRELVAELLFRAVAESATVTYTPAFGYVTDKVLGNAAPTLGYKNFKLEGKADADSFGRPATKWIYNVGDKKTLVVAKADASYTTKVSECDIAKDLGIAKTAKVEKVYTDGIVNATGTNNITSINALKTTSIVGGQGRLTEVYNMGTAGYRIVEINTYLAQVTKVNAAYTDKNGHVIDASVNLTAYVGADNSAANKASTKSFVGVEAEGYAVNDYVLVTISNPGTYAADVESIEKANVAGSGAYKGYTRAAATSTDADTSTFGTTVFNDAAKFFLNKHSDGNYDVLTDTYGNVIGQVDTTKNYLVIEAARWIGDGATTLGGRASADIVLADGTRIQNVTIASIDVNGKNKTANGYSVAEGNPAEASFDTTVDGNTNYYNHLIAYSVDENGNYVLAVNGQSVCAGVGTFTNKTVSITAGNTVMSGKNSAGQTVYVSVNNNTVFLVKGSNGVYTAYTGKANVPSMSKATVCYVTNGNYASLVVVSESSLASNTFDAYVDNDGQYTGNDTLGYRFNVYKVGSDKVSYIYYGLPTLPLEWTADGIYEFTVNSKDQIVDANGNAYGDTGFSAVEAVGKTVILTDFAVGASGHIGRKGVDYSWDRAFTVTSNLNNDGETLFVRNSQDDTYSISTDTKYFVASYSNSKVFEGLKAAEYSDIDWRASGLQLLVGYETDSNGVKMAKYVYVIDVAGAASTDVTAAPVVKADGIVKDKFIKDVVFTVEGTDSNGNAVTVPVSSDVSWSYYDSENHAHKIGDLDQFASNVKYVATFTVTAPYGVKLTGVTSGWPEGATVSLSGNTVTYTVQYNWL